MQVRESDGWTDIVDKTGPNMSLWNFVPASDPAYPAVVKRTVLDQKGDLYIDMRVLCGAPKSACDRLTRDFQTLTEKMKAEMNARR